MIDRRVFENEPLTIWCPPGDISQQQWVKTSMDGDIVQQNDTPLFTEDGLVCGYHVNRTSLVDEGIYECSENGAVVLKVNLKVEGNSTLRFGTNIETLCLAS